MDGRTEIGRDCKGTNITKRYGEDVVEGHDCTCPEMNMAQKRQIAGN